jgi:hypothetical protein
MNHVYAAPTLIIVQVIVHHGDNFSIFHISRCTPTSPAKGLNHILTITSQIGITILISRGMLMPREIMLSNSMNYIILNIRN